MRCKACNNPTPVRFRVLPEVHSVVLEDLCSTCLRWALVSEHNLDPDQIPVLEEAVHEDGADGEGGV